MASRAQFLIDSQWEVMREAADIVAEYLDTKSADKASDSVQASTTASQLSLLNEADAEPEEYDDFRMDFWSTFMQIASQVKYGSPEQARLFELILALVPVLDGSYGNLDEAIRDVWHSPEASHKPPERWEEWVNINSFVARMFSAGLIIERMFAFDTLMVALEQPFESEERMAECEMTAAAQWMKISAAQLYVGFQQGTTNLTQRDIAVLGSGLDKFDGLDALSMDRWKSWRNKFRSFTQKRSMSEAAKTHAREASLAMRAAASEQGDAQHDSAQDSD